MAYNGAGANANANSSNSSFASGFDVSKCKYYHRESEQCYVSDEHLLSEISLYLTLTTTEWIFLVLYIGFFLLGLIGNGLVVWCVVRNSYLRSTTNVLLTNLAVADFLAVLVCMPADLVQTLWETWFLGAPACRMFNYYQGIMIIVSILTLTAISGERYYAICRPMTFKQTRTRVIVCLVVVWVTAHVVAVPRLFTHEQYHNNMVPPNLTILMTSCGTAVQYLSLARHYEVFICIVFYGFPILIMGYAYSAVAWCLWVSAKTSILTETDSRAMMTQLKARRRTAKMLIIVVIAFIVCFLPVYAWNMYRIMEPEDLEYADHDMVSGVTLASHLLMLINSCINPIIYNFMSAKFRKEFKSACHCLVCCFGPSSSQENNTIGYEMDTLRNKQRGRMYEYDSGTAKTSFTEA